MSLTDYVMALLLITMVLATFGIYATRKGRKGSEP